nr:MAG TPA: hypothetical protein [Caudoviricetes sp.]
MPEFFSHVPEDFNSYIFPVSVFKYKSPAFAPSITVDVVESEI